MIRRIVTSPFTFCVLIFAVGGLYWLYDLNANNSATYPMSEQPYSTTYVSSTQCQSCHPGHYESWRRTYHSTMTAIPSTKTVKAPIEENTTVKFYGIDTKFEKVDGNYFVELPFLDGQVRRFPIVYTIGSRRMQQYAIQDGTKIYRIPVFYSIERQRWMHINNAFFRKSAFGMGAFLQGYSLWNPNCIFCHNTRPNPEYNLKTDQFQSHVAETGIACEECHGPGEVHTRVNHNPIRRYYAEFKGDEDRTIQHANKLDKTKSVQVCGQCHGQRVPEPLTRIAQIMTKGDPYVPSANLFEYYKPIEPTVVAPSSELFPLRFWNDNSPRLTAYELQGILESKCFQMSSDMNCQSCHNTHGGDPKGMINPEMRTNAACTGCHEKYRNDDAIVKHTKHKVATTTCYSCHMPDVVYGVMTLHPTHLIRNPDPTRTVNFNMPNECNLCHLEKSVNWSIAEYRRLWNKQLPSGDSTFDEPEIVRGFGVGDAVYRTILLDRAKKSDLKGFEDIYSAGLDDEFYIVNTFATDALEARYHQSFPLPSDWKSFLAGQNITSHDLDQLKTKRTDVAFEFGE